MVLTRTEGNKVEFRTEMHSINQLELDHLFICTEAGAPVVNRLCAAGLQEGSSNIHQGQGTRNRRIFFHNAMLEFLWGDDEGALRSPLIAPSHLWERCHYRATGYSPFGVILRWSSSSSFPPAPDLKTDWASLPFASWAFRPPYLPPHLSIALAEQTCPGEPLIGVIPFGDRPSQFPPEKRQPLDHPLGLRHITRLSLTLSSTDDHPFSDAVQALQRLEGLTLHHGETPLAEVQFDGGHRGQRLDCRPDLPLCLYW